MIWRGTEKKGDGEKERGGTEGEEGQRERSPNQGSSLLIPLTLPRPYPFTVSLCVLQVTFLRDE